MNSPKTHPFDPLTAAEVKLAVITLEKALPNIPLRFKRIDVLEPIKKDVIPYIEAERLGNPLPSKPARLLFSYFHRKDTGAFFKAVINADTKQAVYVKELPEGIQVRKTYKPTLLISSSLASSN